MKISKEKWAIIAGLAALGMSIESFSHGYVSQPASRSYLCKLGDNTNCGAIQYEPQSVEGLDGSPRFPIGGPPDGTIAAAGSPAWSELNVQTPTRWAKNGISAGLNSFTWTFTANHIARDWRYFITTPDWDQSQPLSRAAFESTPFCEHDGGMVRPPMTIQHTCEVPLRDGYQVILAVWDVGDTAASFYNAIDVEFGEQGTAPIEDNPFIEVGSISGAIPLNAGDVIYTRIMDQDGENTSMSAAYTATVATSGAAASLELARIINAQGYFYAGEKSGDTFTPIAGANKIYALENSTIQSIQVAVEFADVQSEYQAILSGVGSPVEIGATGMADVQFAVATNEASNIVATLFDADGKTISSDTFTLDNSMSVPDDSDSCNPPDTSLSMQPISLKLHVHEAAAGEFTLVVVANAIMGNATIQNSATVILTDSNPGIPDGSGIDSCSASDAMTSMHPAFDASTVYNGGEMVSYDGLIYRAKWWTVDDAPDATDAFELLSAVRLEYSDTTVYPADTEILFQGSIYRSNWWTRGSSPLASPEIWSLIGPAPSC
ncbi:lytic polysaccharide monooxygenase [Candidatus Marimicrobium litorale]|uniref:N-acetylglucosamine-binding protein GbpA n=1 Tax=Candidatus Marimicrobium litorale TaxID=2518991 RepID=A0ABT3T8U2_9GAMM|nr:lytic polysaccharide monooxygenase [Candidatus Marimicrobium litorale]MCX2978682.1 N-acetylglucosamine-binding protein GbpA [Candidatus Marimicrobium litorale]